MNTKTAALEITSELRAVLERMPGEASEPLCAAILSARRILAAGAGRSGPAARAFAMRLMHLGLPAYVCGETATPGMGPGDLLFVVSGSGETESLAAMARKAKGLGGNLALLTVRPESAIGRLADAVTAIPAPPPKADNAFSSIQPMGSLFEQCCLVFLDGLVMELMERLSQTEDAMFARHANLE